MRQKQRSKEQEKRSAKSSVHFHCEARASEQATQTERDQQHKTANIVLILRLICRKIYITR